MNSFEFDFEEDIDLDEYWEDLDVDIEDEVLFDVEEVEEF